jgi:hypothetical protein
MSGLAPLTSIALGNTALNTIQGFSSSSQARAQMDAQAQSTAANAARQRQILQLQQDADTRKRQNLLERSTARARVSFGARGISDSDGSAGALLSGLESDFATEQGERDQAFGLQMSGLDQGLAESLGRIEQSRSRNLLDQQQDVQRRVSGLLSWAAQKNR